MAIAWPSDPGFPQFLLMGSVNGGPVDNTVRTQVQKGIERVRQLSAHPTKRFPGALLFPTTALFEEFETFWETTLLNGTQQFNWVHPAKPLEAVTCRFYGMYQLQPQTSTIIRVTCTVDILPS